MAARFTRLVIPGAVLAFVAAAMAMAAPPPAQPPLIPEPAQAILLGGVGLSPGQLVLIRNGQVVVKVLETSHPREVAVAGATRIAISKEAFFERYRDIERFKRHKAVLQLGRFSQPPALSDIAALTVDNETLDDLVECEPGRCKVKLSAAWMTGFRAFAGRPAGARREEVVALARTGLVRYVTDYLARGAAALVVYQDKERPVRLADELAALVGHSPYLDTVSPHIGRYLVGFPGVDAPVVDSFVYWSKEQFGLKPVVSISHVSVHHSPAEPRVIVGASKQLYASHYFEASLGLTFAVDDGDAARPGIYLIYVNRTRADALGGSFEGVRRSVVHSRTREGVADTLARLKRTLEAGAR